MAEDGAKAEPPPQAATADEPEPRRGNFFNGSIAVERYASDIRDMFTLDYDLLQANELFRLQNHCNFLGPKKLSCASPDLDLDVYLYLHSARPSGRVVGVELLFKGADTCRGGKYKAEQMGLHRAKVKEYEETEDRDEGCGLVFGKVPR